MAKKSMKDYLPNATDDYWLIDETLDKIEEKEKKEGAATLSEPEDVVGTIWHVYGIVGNGGLPYFFEHTFDVEEVAKAYEAVGKFESASILRKAISKFPNSRRPKDFKRCVEFMNRHEKFFNSLSTEFWETQNDIEKVLASYIKEHANAFSEVSK